MTELQSNLLLTPEEKLIFKSLRYRVKVRSIYIDSSLFSASNNLIKQI
jgi:hypothetical protein